MLPTKLLRLLGSFTLGRQLCRSAVAVAWLVILVNRADAQIAAANVVSLDALLGRADSVNPSILAARQRLIAARARI